jgi:hypothetical protein
MFDEKVDQNVFTLPQKIARALKAREILPNHVTLENFK